METQDPLLEQIAADVAEIKAHLATLHEEFHRYSPILEAYLRPDATGPGAWAVRRRLSKAGSNGNTAP